MQITNMSIFIQQFAQNVIKEDFNYLYTKLALREKEIKEKKDKKKKNKEKKRTL